MRLRILVVDDEPACRDGLRRLVEAWGHAAQTADSAEDAVVRYAEFRPDVVLTDLVLPGADGIELLRRLRRHDRTPVIVMSGQGSIEQAVEAIKLGAVDFLEKPVTPAGLRERLDDVVGRRTVGIRSGNTPPLASFDPRSVRLTIGASMEQVEREMISRTLQHTGGNKTRAARILGVSTKTMHNKVKKYGL